MMAAHQLFCARYGLLVLLTVVAAASADKCKTTITSDAKGELKLQGGADQPLCYVFKVFNRTNSIYFYIKEKLQKKNVSSILVQNVDKAGKLYTVSNRSLASGNSEKYLVLGYGDSNSTEVARLTVNLTTALAASGSLTIGTFSNNKSDTCEQSFTSLPAKFRLPEYQPGVSSSYRCKFHYMLGAWDELVDSITFTDFHFTSSQASLSLTDDVTKASVSYAGSALPPDYIITNNITLSWSINSQTNDSFTAAHTQSTADCTQMVTVNATGSTVSSPGYPNSNYSNNLDCKTIFTSDDPSKRLYLTLKDVALAMDSDHVEVIDGGASREVYDKGMSYLTALLGYENKDAILVSSGPTVMVRFTTDELGTNKGFSFDVAQTDTSQLFYTPANVKLAPKKNLTDPVYLSIRAPLGSMVTLSPNASELALTGSATVMCYDGDSLNGPLVAVYKAKQDVYDAFSTTHRILCVASALNTSDVFSAATLTATQGLNKLSTSDSGSYSLDVTAAQNVTYEWIVQPESYNTVIQLVISAMKLPAGSANASVLVKSLQKGTYSTLTSDTALPYSIRVPLSSSLRVSMVVTYSKVMTEAAVDVSQLSMTASYTTDNTTEAIADTSGLINSPLYPKSTPALTDKTWSIKVPARKSYHFTFNSQFELSAGANLTISNKSHTYLNMTGPTTVAPGDVILNNTSVNDTLDLNIKLNSKEQSKTTGVQISYELLDAGYSSPILNTPQMITTPNYSRTLNYSYKASWVFSVAHNDSKGLLQRVQAQVTFNSSTPAVLELRDGPRADSPMLTMNKGNNSVLASSNYLYVSYRYTAAKQNGSALQIISSVNKCANSSQCIGMSNLTVCMPSTWRCDHIYQCMDGKDELNCGAPPTTKPPPVTKEGAQWWVVALCILAGVVLGIIGSVIVIVIIMRRRGRGYNRLSELMTPVPT